MLGPIQQCPGAGGSPAQFCAQGLSLLVLQPQPSQAELCCALSAREVTQGGRLAWPTDSTSLLLCSWLFPISPCASLPGCVRAVVAAQAKGCWRTRTAGEEVMPGGSCARTAAGTLLRLSPGAAGTAPVLSCLTPQAPREIVLDSAHLLFQNRGGLSAPRGTEVWYLMGLNWKAVSLEVGAFMAWSLVTSTHEC